MKAQRKQNRPTDWQRNPENIKTATVQHWARGVMMGCQMTQAKARELVASGQYFVMCDQAIGWINPEGYMES